MSIWWAKTFTAQTFKPETGARNRSSSPETSGIQWLVIFLARIQTTSLRMGSLHSFLLKWDHLCRETEQHNYFFLQVCISVYFSIYPLSASTSEPWFLCCYSTVDCYLINKASDQKGRRKKVSFTAIQAGEKAAA